MLIPILIAVLFLHGSISTDEVFEVSLYRITKHENAHLHLIGKEQSTPGPVIVKPEVSPFGEMFRVHGSAVHLGYFRILSRKLSTPYWAELVEILEKLNLTAHLFGVQYLMDQHQSADDVLD